MKNNSTSVIIGHSNTHPTRQRNLEAIVNFYKTFNFEIIIIEQNSESPKIDGVIHKRFDTGKPYGRSFGFNEGAKIASGDLFIFSDNDCLPSMATMRVVGMGIFRDIDMYIPYQWVLDLTEEDTKELISSGKTKGGEPRTHKGEKIVNHGGVTVITRNSFTTVGGFDPQFWGWGGEDYAFFSKCHKLLKWKRSPYDMYHLDHDRQYKRALNPEANKNREEAHRIANMSKSELIIYIKNLGTAHFIL